MARKILLEGKGRKRFGMVFFSLSLSLVIFVCFDLCNE